MLLSVRLDMIELNYKAQNLSCLVGTVQDQAYKTRPKHWSHRVCKRLLFFAFYVFIYYYFFCGKYIVIADERRPITFAVCFFFIGVHQ